MRFLTWLVLLPWVAHATPVQVDLERSAPDQPWADAVYLTGTDEVTMVVTPGGSGERPGLWRAFDPQGRELWRQEHTCPDLADFPTLLTFDGRAVCKRGHEVMAVDIATGAEVWRYVDTRRLYMTAGAQGRLAVSANNEELLVFDVKGGGLVLRLDTPGATFEEVAPTPAGPMAFFVQDPPGKVERTVELDLGQGPQRVVVSGLDPDRRLIAVPIGGAAQAIQPLKPLWSVPFEGYSFEVRHSDGAVITEPSEDLRVAWDAHTGKRLWTHKLLDGEVSTFGHEGGVFAAQTGKSWLFGVLDARTGKARWQHDTRSSGARPSVSQSMGQALFESNRVLQVRALADGKRLVEVPIPMGYELKTARATRAMIVWVIQREGERSVFVRPR